MGLELSGLVGPPDDGDRAYDANVETGTPSTADDEYWDFVPQPPEEVPA